MKTSRKFSWLIIDRGIRLLTTFANTAVLARSLGPSEYGDFAKGLLLYTFADSVCSLGIPVVLAGRIASDAYVHRLRLLGRSIAARLAAGLVVYGGFALYSLSTASGFSGEAVAAGMLLALFTSQWAFGDAFLQGVGAPQRGALAKIIVAIAFTTIRIVLALVGRPTLGFWVGMFVAEHLVLTAVMLNQCRTFQGAHGVAAESSPAIGRSLRKDAFYVWASQVATLLYMRIDQVALAAISTPIALASYSIASQLIEQAYTLPVIINSVTISELGRDSRENNARFKERMVNQYMWGIVLGICCFIAMAILGRLLVLRLYGSGYALARSLIPILSFSIPFVTVGTLQVSEIVIAKSPRILLWKAVSSAVLSAPLAILGWYAMGPVGLAASAVAVQIFSCVVLNYWVDRDALRKQAEAIRVIAILVCGGFKKWGLV